MQAIKCNDQINIINNKKTLPIIVVGIGEKNGVRTYDFIRQNPEILTASIYRFELKCADILEIVNDLITINAKPKITKHTIININ